MDEIIKKLDLIIKKLDNPQMIEKCFHCKPRIDSGNCDDCGNQICSECKRAIDIKNKEKCYICYDCKIHLCFACTHGDYKFPGNYSLCQPCYELRQ